MIKYYYYSPRPGRAIFYKVIFMETSPHKAIQCDKVELDDCSIQIQETRFTAGNLEEWETSPAMEITRELWDYQLLIAYGFI